MNVGYGFPRGLGNLRTAGPRNVVEGGERIPNRMKVVVQSMGDEGEPWIIRDDQEVYG